ncbi:hypothetical protein Taro_002577 [Colocasia esculenta]|uniref:Uncharacterized protein n=1 Tax=Colocasia esculenta TaxID=4460 RepID=A0A843THG5_COLES|nr:hypothetical protein [Colocasia esculenta]
MAASGAELRRTTLLGLCIVLSHLVTLCSGCSFTISNDCPHTIWPATLAGAGTPQLATTGFQLDSGQSARIAATPGWSGRIWARTGCMFDEGGAGGCQTGDCGGRLECAGVGALPPATLFEITMGKGTDWDFYDVSLVDGYNLPVYAAPRVAASQCNATGCISDLNSGCPKELQLVVGGNNVIACKSACEAFRLDKYCCSGEYADPVTCKPTSYSAIFKTACPRAYSYAFDDLTSTFICKASEYSITFCPTANSYRRSSSSSGGQPAATPQVQTNLEPQATTSSSNKLSFTLPLLISSILFLWKILKL